MRLSSPPRWAFVFFQFLCNRAKCLDFAHSSPCMKTSIVNRDSASILLSANGKYRGDNILKGFWKNWAGFWMETLNFCATAATQNSHKIWSSSEVSVQLWLIYVVSLASFTFENFKLNAQSTKHIFTCFAKFSRIVSGTLNKQRITSNRLSLNQNFDFFQFVNLNAVCLFSKS